VAGGEDRHELPEALALPEDAGVGGKVRGESHVVHGREGGIIMLPGVVVFDEGLDRLGFGDRGELGEEKLAVGEHIHMGIIPYRAEGARK
jgi:hypothetical protein